MWSGSLVLGWGGRDLRLDPWDGLRFDVWIGNLSISSSPAALIRYLVVLFLKPIARLNISSLTTEQIKQYVVYPASHLCIN